MNNHEWPECFITGVWCHDGNLPPEYQQKAAIAQGLNGWALCMSGNAPPKNFGLAMAKISVFTGCFTPEEFMRKAKSFKNNKNEQLQV